MDDPSLAPPMRDVRQPGTSPYWWCSPYGDTSRVKPTRPSGNIGKMLWLSRHLHGQHTPPEMARVRGQCLHLECGLVRIVGVRACSAADRTIVDRPHATAGSEPASSQFLILSLIGNV